MLESLTELESILTKAFSITTSTTKENKSFVFVALLVNCDGLNVNQGHADMKLDEGSSLDNSLRTRRQRFKPEVSFSEVELKTISPINDVSGGCCTR